MLSHSPAAGQAPTNDSTYDSTSVGRRGGFQTPFWVMMRSAVFPGWGQMHNGSWLKALILGGAEAAFLYGVFQEDRLAEDAAKKMELYPEFESYYRDLSSSHRSKKKDYVWWGAFAALLSLGDAYVGAHLHGFNAEFRSEDSAILLSLEVYP